MLRISDPSAKMLGSDYCLLKMSGFKNPSPEANGTPVRLQFAIKYK